MIKLMVMKLSIKIQSSNLLIELRNTTKKRKPYRENKHSLKEMAFVLIIMNLRCIFYLFPFRKNSFNCKVYNKSKSGSYFIKAENITKSDGKSQQSPVNALFSQLAYNFLLLIEGTLKCNLTLMQLLPSPQTESGGYASRFLGSFPDIDLSYHHPFLNSGLFCSYHFDFFYDYTEKNPKKQITPFFCSRECLNESHQTKAGLMCWGFHSGDRTVIT